MPIGVSGLPGYIHTLIGTTAALTAALSLVCLKPHKKALALLTTLAAVTAVRFASLFLPPAVPVWLVTGAVCVTAGCLLFRADIYYSTVAALLTGLFMGFNQLAYRYLLQAGPGIARWMWLVDLLALAAAALCCIFNIALLPDAAALPVAAGKEQRGKLQISLIYVIASLALANLWLLFTLKALEPLSHGLRLALVALTAAASILLMGYIRRLAFSAVERIEALVDKQYQSDLLSFMQVIRSQRHDFNFHMRTISGLIRQRKYQECDEYIEQMVKNADALNDVLPLRHPATSAVIHAFSEMAAQRGISFDINIASDLARLPCTVYETNAIIGNLLQNAIDELEQEHHHGPIQLLILFRGGYYIIRVTNPCRHGPQELQDIFRPGFSTKQSHEGIGLAAVQRIVSRYKGYVFPEFRDGSISLIVELPLRG